MGPTCQVHLVLFWLPESQISGMYILLADDTEDGFHTDSDWTPLLHEYQQVTAEIIARVPTAKKHKTSW